MTVAREKTSHPSIISMARGMQGKRSMATSPARRCALWVSPPILSAAQELADLVGLDVDSFIAMMVLELHDQETAEGRLRARAAGAARSSDGRVIPLPAERTKRPRRSQARIQ